MMCILLKQRGTQSSNSEAALAYLSGACLCSTQVAQSGGYAGVMDVTAMPVVQDDTMQSFWLAETLKYAWLIFAPPDALDLRTHVLNTEVRMPDPMSEESDVLSGGRDASCALRMSCVNAQAHPMQVLQLL